ALHFCIPRAQEFHSATAEMDAAGLGDSCCPVDDWSRSRRPARLRLWHRRKLVHRPGTEMSMPATNPRINTTASNRSALVGFAIGIVLIHLAINVAHGVAHQHLAIGLDAFQKTFVAVVILVAPLYAAYLIWKGNLRTGGMLLAVTMAAALIFGVYYHFIAPGP